MEKQIVLIALFICFASGLKKLPVSSPTLPFNGEGLVLGMTYNLESKYNGIFFADPKTGQVKHRDDYVWSFQTNCAAADDVHGWYYLIDSYTLWNMNYTTGVIMDSIQIDYSPLATFYDPINNRIVGVFMDNRGNNIGYIEPTTGAVHILVNFNDTFSVIGDGYAYDPVDQMFYVNVEDDEDSGQNYMYVFDLKQKKIVGKLPMVDSVQAVQVDRHSSSVVSLLAVAFNSNSFVRINTKTGQFTVLLKDVPGIPGNAASAIDNVNGRYYLQVIVYSNQFWLTFDSKSGALLSKAQTVDTWTHIFLLASK